MKYIVFVFAFLFSSEVLGKDFALSDQWLKLVHYQKKFLSTYQGSIDNEHFYLSPEGKNNPQAELNATIRLFEGQDQVQKCRFPARYILLKKQNLIKTELGECSEYETFKQDLQASGITLLFADAFMNNSSSLFGHTLFRIDSSRASTQMLAHGINYGAFTKGFEDTPFYALYGLLGFFQGGLTTRPYYDTINTYNNIENRDLWEYELDLTPEQKELFVAHVWEIGQVTTPYYFFSKNCSYMLVEMLDAVDPNLNLAQRFKGYVIPLDTVKAVYKKGLIKKTNYRPSRRNKIKNRIDQMSAAQYQSFLNLIDDENADILDLDDSSKADVLETAYQYLQYQYTAQQLDLKKYRTKSFKILRQRNQYKAGQTFDSLKEGNNPILSHDSAQIGFSIGFQNGKAFQELRFRPAYHDLTDNPFGYLKGAAINFLELFLRHYDDHDRYVFENLKILELVSLSPIDRAFQAVSYRLNVELTRMNNLIKGKTGYVSKTELALGATFEPLKNLYLYVLGGFDAAYGGFLKQNAYAGLSPIGGLLYSSELFSFQAELKKTFASQKEGSLLKSKALISYHVAKNLSLELSYERSYVAHKALNQTMMGFKYFF